MKRKLILSTLLSIIVGWYACEQKNTVKESSERDFSAARDRFTNNCSGCHGAQMQAFTDRRWKHGNEPDSLYQTIKFGREDLGMPSFKDAFTEEELLDLVAYIRTGIEKTGQYNFYEQVVSDTFPTTADFQLKLDTVYSGGSIPWGMAFLPDGSMLVSEKAGQLYQIGPEGDKLKIEGVPETREFGQGGLMDIELHPDFENNQTLFLTYSKLKVEGEDTLATTAVSSFTFANGTLTDPKELLVALPFSKKPYHFGSRLEFDPKGYLFLSVGDRGSRDVNPQSLKSFCGKIHRINSDGSIPENNPFVEVDSAIASIYSYGHRNPQGLAFNSSDGHLWEHEHGPRGGDELNIIGKGFNYGWPEVSFGINYDGTIFTSDTVGEGFEEPIHYWVPSIAPCGMDFIDSDVYPGWENHLLVASLRFRYLNLCKIEGTKVVSEEHLLPNIGRIRNVKMGPDGYIYVAVENPGYIFRLLPISR
ncbi:PQQ-dependent sugar dehydrogenase [Reichenbachiella ulvae]|uniref:PQQ-dependent sugar dehydrogenase n=1 Tax=Reichenbachiella ulvae TaxID=2980104 RepID=A0ABT3CYY4_9BACT|nr:PQQ-dependent sugar dehydrogenase [Reichenbachiella ulvae]MCV9388729.1 PQQ-dependent sugar dehydrogenase [Reichenbachiella ulvae]